MPYDPTRRNFLAVAGIGAFAAPPKNELDAVKPAAAAKAPPMRVLGKTGMKVNILGFGCMTTSDPSVIERAVETGVNYFDTARGYQQGNNERMVGAALKKYRDRIFIASKSGAKTADALLADLDKSLSELGTDHLDVWHLHARSKPEDIPEELFDAQDKAKQAGKIRFAGVSTHSGHSVLIPWLLEKKRTDVILSSYNFSMTAEMDELMDRCAAAGVGVVAMKIMAGGFKRIKDDNPMLPKLKREGGTAAALKWALRRPSVGTSIPGIMDLDQLQENWNALSTPYTPQDAQILAQQLKHVNPLYCRGCLKCEGTCAQGLPVHDLIRFAMYADGYGEFALGRERFQELSQEVQSVRCSDCSTCTVQCPHGVNVAGRCSLAQEWFA
jgi:aryl-alcohol dehydrogenase-like predicted oxidoreductase